MSDDTQTSGSPAAPDSVAQVPGRRRLLWRWARRALALVTALLAAVIVTFFSIDLGRFPQIKRAAEGYASRYLERPMHIGRISALVSPGWFALDDIVIEGRQPGDRPFFKAGRILVHVPWLNASTLFRKQIVVEMEITDWRMVVERWSDRTNVPRLTPRNPSTGPRSYTTTVNFVYAKRGEFVYEDHVTPWSVIARNLGFDLVRSAALRRYVGHSYFSNGTVQIQQYLPMRTDFSSRFVLDGPRVWMQHIDLTTDGTVSHVNGTIDFTKWPEQTYNVNSTIDFPRMREIFFAKESWRLGGTGQFTGVFKLFREGGYELAGDFASDEAAVNALEFPDLHGSLIWNPQRFAVTHADAKLLGGETRFTYGLAPFGSPTGATASFSADYANVDLAGLDRLVDLRGLELAGLASGNLAMTWPNGKFSIGQGSGRTFVTAPAGAALAPLSLPSDPLPRPVEPRPFDPRRSLSPMALSANVFYRFDSSGWTFEESRASTEATAMTFRGRMARTGTSDFSFHVTSHDWQESDRVLAAIMTAVSGPTGAVEVAGRGTFDGVMTGTFSAPRIAGTFTGESTRVWDVTWGKVVGDVVIQGGYVDISRSLIGDRPDATIVATGRFALGYRKDNAEEINAKVTLAGWPMKDLRHAFNLDDWPMDGVIGSATLSLTGKYREMFGTGQLRIDNGMAWGERFEVASADLELEGSGLRVDRIEMQKGPGVIHGSARIGWNGSYAFTADGAGIPVESLDNFKMEKTALTGRLQFDADGAGEFEDPTYNFRGLIEDLFVADQGIGRVQGDIRIAGRTLLIDRVRASSSLLDVYGTGQITLNDAYDAELHFRFSQSSIDPYLQFFAPSFSPYTRAIVSGTLDASGPLSVPERLSVQTEISDATLTLFDYELKNDGPIRLDFSDGQFKVVQTTAAGGTAPGFRLKGSDTNLELTGGAHVSNRVWDLAANGDASLSILQLFFPGLASSGAATLNASLTGSFTEPRLNGSATLVEGRLRPFSSPHSLEALNGRIRFDGTGVNLDGMTGRIGNGEVRFGGTIDFEQYQLSQYNLTATGTSMTLRYPTGFNSTVDMALRLVGSMRAPRLTGTIDVIRVSYTAGAQAESSVFGLTAVGSGGLGASDASVGPIVEDGIPLALDIQVSAPPRLAFIDIERTGTRIEGTMHLRVSGTFNRPVILGDIQIAGGAFAFNGIRYIVREGSIDFRSPDRLDPIFDVAADARPRLQGRTFDVSIRVTGTLDSLQSTLISEPALPETDIVALLLGGTPNPDALEQNALSTPQESQQRMVQQAGAVILTSALAVSSRVGSIFERALPFALDTVQITPVLGNEAELQNLSGGARVTLGRRISPRLFLTYSRVVSASATATQDEIILLEYDQSDRISWVLSRNEDRSFALDVRVRFGF